MDELLKPVTDEVEESPDNQAPEPKPEPKAEAKEADKSEPAKSAEPPQGETDDERGKRMHALPKWAHERLRANDEKTTAAERRAQEAERRAAELEARINGGSQQERREEPEVEYNRAVYETRVELGWDRAVEKYGQEYASQATHWARDRMASDPIFRAQVLNAADPVGFSIKELKKAETASELEKYGYDIDALVKARAGQVQTDHAPQPAAGAPGASQPKPAMPSDFAGAPSGAQRSGQQWSGPTPLGDLIKTRR